MRLNVRSEVQVEYRALRVRDDTMAVLSVLGVMDLVTMAVVTASITIERLAPAGERVARAIGAVAVMAACLLIAAALG